MYNCEIINLNLVGSQDGSPLTPKQQYHSPYLSMSNNPIDFVDPDGGYTWFGAAWRRAADIILGKDVSKIYKVGKEHAFNSDGIIRGARHSNSNPFGSTLSNQGLVSNLIGQTITAKVVDVEYDFWKSSVGDRASYVSYIGRTEGKEGKIIT